MSHGVDRMFSKPIQLMPQKVPITIFLSSGNEQEVGLIQTN